MTTEQTTLSTTEVTQLSTPTITTTTSEINDLEWEQRTVAPLTPPRLLSDNEANDSPVTETIQEELTIAPLTPLGPDPIEFTQSEVRGEKRTAEHADLDESLFPDAKKLATEQNKDDAIVEEKEDDFKTPPRRNSVIQMPATPRKVRSLITSTTFTQDVMDEQQEEESNQNSYGSFIQGTNPTTLVESQPSQPPVESEVAVVTTKKRYDHSKRKSTGGKAPRKQLATRKVETVKVWFAVTGGVHVDKLRTDQAVWSVVDILDPRIKFVWKSNLRTRTPKLIQAFKMCIPILSGTIEDLDCVISHWDSDSEDLIDKFGCKEFSEIAKRWEDAYDYDREYDPNRIMNHGIVVKMTGLDPVCRELHDILCTVFEQNGRGYCQHNDFNKDTDGLLFYSYYGIHLVTENVGEGTIQFVDASTKLEQFEDIKTILVIHKVHLQPFYQKLFEMEFPEEGELITRVTLAKK